MQESWKRTRDTRAFTLTEMMTAIAVFMLSVVGLISLQTFCYRMSALTGSELTSVGYGLTALDSIRDEVRGASSVLVGNGTGTLFSATGTTGNTLEIYPTTNSNYIQVYLNTNSTSLYLINGSNSSPFLIAAGITNQTAFQLVNYTGNTYTNTLDHYAITMTLQFRQLAYTVPSGTYECYTMQTTMTPRTQN
jgi:hypothetical protein